MDQTGRNFEQFFSMWKDTKLQRSHEHIRLDSSTTNHDALLDLQISQRRFQEENTLLINQLQDLSVENRSLTAKLQLIEQTLDDLYNDKIAKGAARLEIEELKQNNNRLIYLLSQTEEFKDVFEKGDQVSFLGYKYQTPSAQQLKLQSLQKDEKLLWVPQKAIQVLRKYGLTDDELWENLTQINQIFHDHWGQRFKKVKTTAQQETATIKRQLNSRQPYDSVQKKILSSAVKKEKSRILQDKQATNIAQVQVCYKQIKQLEDQVESLKSQLAFANDTDPGNKKDIFIKGAEWMIQRVLRELDNYGDDLEKVQGELNYRIESLLENLGAGEHQIFTRIYKWLMDVIDQISSNFHLKIKNIATATNARFKG